jgi:signal transduction histidine kinase
MDYEDKPQFAPLDLGEILDDVLLPLEPLIHEKNISLKVQPADGVTVQGDRTQIHRLFGILIDNAIKYSSGEISVSIEKPAQITVQNSSAAIPAEKLEKLFDRFYRGDEAHEYTGSFGLGLAIAKAIVETHKGKISCKSDEAGGTRFTVRF